MARTPYPADTFESLAKELSGAVTTLNAIAAAMQESGLPSALIHGSSTTTVYVPAVLDWVEKTNADVKSQIRAYLAGVPSSAEFHKAKTEKQKLASAKKPSKRSPPKK